MSERVEKLKDLPWSERQTPAYAARLAQLGEEALRDSRAAQSLREWMGLDAINFAYFLTRWRAFHSPRTGGELFLHGGPGDPPPDAQLAYSVATAPKELAAHLPWVAYEAIRTPENVEAGQRSVVWLKKMMAGTGSSLDRTEYLKKLDRPTTLGAKGTDLFVPMEDGTHASLAELQILRSVRSALEGDFKEVLFHDIVGSETQQSIAALWEASARGQEGSYRQWIESLASTRHTGKSFQAHLPTVDEEGKLTYARHAPGGHGLFGLEELLLAARGDVPASKPVSVIGNGEDLSAQPDSAMVGWMVKQSIPIAMITTTKTSVDKKGGQIAVVDAETPYVTIVEVAQAEGMGQGELFQQLGLRAEDDIALFNTNMALFNHQQLVPKMKKLLAEVGEEGLMSALSPDLIRNPKKQVDPDGKTRTYTQLEGAMGSVLLTLDRFWRSHYGEPLVHFINVEPEQRTAFFSPIKTPFDFVMQFHSDRFSFNPDTFSMVDHCPGKIPRIALTGSPREPKYYGSLHHTLRAFEGVRIREMESLEVRGKVHLPGARFAGQVQLVVEGEAEWDGSQPAIPRAHGHVSLRDLRVEVGPSLKTVPIRNRS